MPYLYSDHTKVDFTTEESSYLIGTELGISFASEELCLLSTVDCLIKINDENFWQPIYANDYFTFKRKINKITFKGESENGTLEIWAEGGETSELIDNVETLKNQLIETQEQLTDIQAQTTNIEQHHILRRKIEGDYLYYYDGETIVSKYKLVKDTEGRIIERIPETP